MQTDRRTLLLGAASLGAGLSACANDPVNGFDRARRALDIANSGEPNSLDPHKASGAWENNIIGNMFVGLVTENERAEPVPGMAERWETSEDGLTWTFFLREAFWSDGAACNAHDFEFAFRRILDPANLAGYASILFPIKNAEAVNSRKLLPPDQIGVTAIDDLTLEIQLEHPAPYLLQLLKHHTAYPVPKHVVRQYGDSWIHPEHAVVNGPYTLKTWWSNYMVHLARNPRFHDAGNVKLEHLYFYPTNDVNTTARNVESGERGWATLFPTNQVDDLRRALPGYVRVAPYLEANYYAFNLAKPPFNDARVRRALSMALDREFLATQVYKTGERDRKSVV